MELREKVVTFIPTASTPESYKEYVKLGQESLEELGLKVTPLDVATASSEEIRSTLSEGDLIYISGGNTFYLLQELKRKGADKLIQREIERGKPYIGESAGGVAGRGAGAPFGRRLVLITALSPRGWTR